MLQSPETITSCTNYWSHNVPAQGQYSLSQSFSQLYTHNYVALLVGLSTKCLHVAVWQVEQRPSVRYHPASHQVFACCVNVWEQCRRLPRMYDMDNQIILLCVRFLQLATGTERDQPCPTTLPGAGSISNGTANFGNGCLPIKWTTIALMWFNLWTDTVYGEVV